MTTPDHPDAPRPDEAGDADSSGHGEKRSRLQEPAIAALLECQTIKQAAERVGISEKTLRNWMHEPDFAQAYREARRARVDRAVSRLENGFEIAVAVLQQVATSATSPPYAKVAAARGLIDAGFKAVEMHDFAERLARIEARLLNETGRRGCCRDRATGRPERDAAEELLRPEPCRRCGPRGVYGVAVYLDGFGQPNCVTLWGEAFPDACSDCKSELFGPRRPLKVLGGIDPVRV